jgi:hypothetical protein
MKGNKDSDRKKQSTAAFVGMDSEWNDQNPSGIQSRASKL